MVKQMVYKDKEFKDWTHSPTEVLQISLLVIP